MMTVREFVGAWRGIWLFTWRAQLTWRKLVSRVLLLLALPLLICVTLRSPEDWVQMHPMFGDPIHDVNSLALRLARHRPPLPLRPEQRTQLQQIFAEEYRRAALEAQQDQNGPTGIGHQTQHIRDCYDRIQVRINGVGLDSTQSDQLQASLQERRQRDEQNANGSAGRWTRPFYHFLVNFYFFVILPLGCVRGAGALIRDELQANTLSFLTVRPIYRHELLILEFLAQTAWQQIVFFAETLLIFGAGWLRHVPDLGVLLPLFLAAQFLAVFAWNALGLLLGLITRRYLALALIYGAVVELGIGAIPTNINTLSLMRHLKSLLMHNDALEEVFQWAGKGPIFSVSALVAAGALFVAAAALLFTYREYHHAGEMQK